MPSCFRAKQACFCALSMIMTFVLAPPSWSQGTVKYWNRSFNSQLDYEVNDYPTNALRSTRTGTATRIS